MPSPRALATALAFLCACAVASLGAGGCAPEQWSFEGDAGSDAPDDAGAEADSAPPIGCTSDSDCSFLRLFCDTTSGQCVACVKDSQCPAGRPQCDLPLHECVQCTTAGDCPGGETCADGRCVPACFDGGSCPPNERCSPTLNICVQCISSGDCADPTPICDFRSGTCVECVWDTQCSTTHCNPTTEQCVDCLTQDDCQPGEICDPTTYTCTPSRFTRDN